MSHIHEQVRVFDIVEFSRLNEHCRPPRWERHNAVWMEAADTIYVYFGGTWTGFSQSVKVGDEFLLGGIAKETRPAEPHNNPPKGYDHLPERVKVIRPQKGGLQIVKDREKRAAKVAARNAKLGL